MTPATAAVAGTATLTTTAGTTATVAWPRSSIVLSHSADQHDADTFAHAGAHDLHSPHSGTALATQLHHAAHSVQLHARSQTQTTLLSAYVPHHLQSHSVDQQPYEAAAQRTAVSSPVHASGALPYRTASIHQLSHQQSSAVSVAQPSVTVNDDITVAVQQQPWDMDTITPLPQHADNTQESSIAGSPRMHATNSSSLAALCPAPSQQLQLPRGTPSQASRTLSHMYSPTAAAAAQAAEQLADERLLAVSRHSSVCSEGAAPIHSRVTSCVTSSNGYDSDVQITRCINVGKDAVGREQVNQYVFDEALETELGTGSFASVKRVIDTRSNAYVAMKLMSKTQLRRRKGFGRTRTRTLTPSRTNSLLPPSSGQPLGSTTAVDHWENVKREIAIMKRLRHAYIVRLLEVLDDEAVDTLYLVLEYCEHGSCLKGDTNTHPLPLHSAKKYFMQALLAVEYCNTQAHPCAPVACSTTCVHARYACVLPVTVSLSHAELLLVDASLFTDSTYQSRDTSRYQ